VKLAQCEQSVNRHSLLAANFAPLVW